MIPEDRAFSEIGHASLTVAEILALDVVQRASPLVLAGAEHLDRPVRWVHISEQPDIADCLMGSELLLTTLIALGADARFRREFIRPLAGANPETRLRLSVALRRLDLLQAGRGADQFPSSAAGRQRG